jgi:hypothetical protein
VPGVGRLSLVGVVAMLVAISLWFVPMMVVTSAGGDLLAYRNEILFQQTVTRYADAWHHHEPFHYYFTRVIPVLWLPLVALVPWLWPRWRSGLRERDTLTAVLLAWVALVLAFFTFSTGKRGLYVLPAVPALAMAAAPWLPELLRAKGTRRVAFGLGAALVAFAALAAVYFSVDGKAAERVVRDFGIQPVVPLVIMAAIGAIPLVWLRLRDGWLAYGSPRSSRSDSSCIPASTAYGPAGRSWNGSRRRASRSPNWGSRARKNSTCSSCAGPATTSATPAGASERPRRRMPPRGWQNARAGRCWSRNGHGTPVSHGQKRSTWGGRTGNAGTSFRARRIRIAYAGVTGVSHGCTCRRMPL